MSLIPRMPAEPEREPLSVRVPATLIEQLREYAAFVRGTKDYVITAALDRLFKQDREFIQWKESRLPVGTGSEKTAGSPRSAASERTAAPGMAPAGGATEPSNASTTATTASAARGTHAATQPRTTPKAIE